MADSTESVVDIVKAVANSLTFKTTPGLTFGHGPIEYRNLHGDTEEEPPLIVWLEDFSIDDTMSQNGVLQHVYNIAILFGKQTDLTANPAELETLIRLTELMSKEFIHRFLAHASIDTIVLIVRNPLYYQDDFCTSGYLLLLRAKTEYEKFTLHCD